MRRNKPRANANHSKRRKVAHKRKRKQEKERRAANKGKHGAWRACSRKKRSPTKEDAVIRAERIMHERGIELRVYHCPFCGGWHLTSKCHGNTTTHDEDSESTTSSM